MPTEEQWSNFINHCRSSDGFLDETTMSELGIAHENYEEALEKLRTMKTVKDAKVFHFLITL